MAVKHSLSRCLGSSSIALVVFLCVGAIATLNPTTRAIATPVSLFPDAERENSTLPPKNLSTPEESTAIASIASPTATLHEIQHATTAPSTPVSSGLAQLDPPENWLAQVSSSCPGGLQVETVKGVVTFEGRPLQAGDCLQPAIGTIVTGVDSNARLRFDNFRGSLEVQEVSEFDVETLADANIDLFVRRGQVRFSLGRLTSDFASTPSGNPVALKNFLSTPEASLLTQNRTNNSPFRVRTPTGVAGVRGTSFGIDVGPNGQTGVRTIAGNVVASAQGQEVTVGPNQFTAIGEGLPPSAPQAIPPESEFRVLVTKRRGSNRVRIQGKIDAPDILLLDGEAIDTNPDGSFSLMVPRPASGLLRFVVRGPAVRQRIYVVAI